MNVSVIATPGGEWERERKKSLALSLSLETTHCLLLPPSSILAPLRQNLFTVILLPEEGEEEEGFQKPLDGLLPFLPRGRGGKKMGRDSNQLG